MKNKYKSYWRKSGLKGKWGEIYLNHLDEFKPKNFLEIGAGYKNIGFTNFLLMVKTKFGLSVAYAYEFGIPSGQASVTRSGNELFIKFNF